MNKFKIKDKGSLSYFLGLEIKYYQKNGILSISQTRYIENFLEKFGMTNSNNCNIPMDPNLKIIPNQDVEKCNQPYREP